MHLLIFGLGYTSKYVESLALKEGYKVYSTARSGDKDYKLYPPEFIPRINFQNITHILISIPPDEDGDIVYRYYKEQLLEARDLKWVGYYSSTSVYGDYNGEYVTEDSELKGMDDVALSRIKAEKNWLDFYEAISGVQVDIFRLSGIYGPGRSVVEKIKNGKREVITKQGQFFSRIHVEDIAYITLSAMNSIPLTNASFEVYNLADDMPTSPEEPYIYASQQMNLPMPQLISYNDCQLTGMLKSFYTQNKKVSNEKIKQKFNIKLKYPSYKEGLVL